MSLNCSALPLAFHAMVSKDPLGVWHNLSAVPSTIKLTNKQKEGPHGPTKRHTLHDTRIS
jgi:hypothetical protein